MTYTPDFLKSIARIYTSSQLYSHRLADKTLQIGDIVIFRYKVEEQEHNPFQGWHYVKKTITKVGLLHGLQETDSITKKFITVYEESGSTHETILSDYDNVQIWAATFDSYEKDLVKYNKKVSKKIAEDNARKEALEKARIAQEEKNAAEEKQRKEKEEFERIEHENREKIRRSMPFQITVGVWEDLMERLSVLENKLEKVADIAENVDYRTSYHGEEE